MKQKTIYAASRGSYSDYRVHASWDKEIVAHVALIAQLDSELTAARAQVAALRDELQFAVDATTRDTKWWVPVVQGRDWEAWVKRARAALATPDQETT